MFHMKHFIIGAPLALGGILRKEKNMGPSLTSAITLVTSTFSSIVAWTPVLFAAGFAVVRFGISTIMRIIGARRGARRRR